MLNGRVVNVATSSLSKGRIAFQSHGAEIFIREIQLTPLAKASADKSKKEKSGKK